MAVINLTVDPKAVERDTLKFDEGYWVLRLKTCNVEAETNSGWVSLEGKDADQVGQIMAGASRTRLYIEADCRNNRDSTKSTQRKDWITLQVKENGAWVDGSMKWKYSSLCKSLGLDSKAPTDSDNIRGQETVALLTYEWDKRIQAYKEHLSISRYVDQEQHESFHSGELKYEPRERKAAAPKNEDDVPF